MKNNPPWWLALVILPSVAGGYFVPTHRPYLNLPAPYRPYIGLTSGALLILIGARWRRR